jgi:hypothetical protein
MQGADKLNERLERAVYRSETGMLIFIVDFKVYE